MSDEIRRLLEDATVMAEELETETPLDAAQVMRRLIDALRASQRPPTEEQRMITLVYGEQGWVVVPNPQAGMPKEPS